MTIFLIKSSKAINKFSFIYFFDNHSHFLKIIFRYILIFNSCVETLLDKLCGCGESPVEVSELIHLLTMDTMLQCIMSSQTDCQKTA